MAVGKRDGVWTLEKGTFQKTSYGTAMKQPLARIIICTITVTSAQDQPTAIDTITFSQIGIALRDTLPDFKTRNLS